MVTRSIFLAVSFWCTVTALSAQNIVLIDSLRKIYSTASPEKKYLLLNSIGFEYRYSFPDSTIAYCSKAYSFGKSLHLPKDLSRPLSFMGLAYANKGDYKSSLNFHYRAIDVAVEQHDSVQLAFGYNNLGRMFFDEGDVSRAFNNFVRSRELFEILKNKSGLAYVYRSLANVYKTRKDFTQALEMSNRAYQIRKELGEPRAIVSALIELGLLYETMNDNAEALKKFALADSIALQLHDKVTQVEVKMGMAEILFKRGKYDEAYNETASILSVISSKTNQKIYLRACLLRANYFYQRRDYIKATPLLKKIYTEANNNLSFKREAAFILSEIYSNSGDEESAGEYSNAYKIVDQKLQNNDLTNQISQLKFKLELEKIERENAILKVNETKDLAIISSQRIERNVLLISLVSILFVLIILWIYNRRRRIINYRLEQQNQQIKLQGEEIEFANQNLSQRNKELSDLNYEKDTLMNIVAHDLKSPINQILGFAQLMEIEGGLTTQHKEYIKYIKDATQSGLGLIVDLLDVNALREMKGEVILQPFNLGLLITGRVKAFENSADAKGIKIELIKNVNDTVVSEPKYINRILDNLISNAIKFSTKDSVVQISCVLEGNTAKISVRDHGPGFSEEDRKFMFQRFRKLSARPTGGESSNGLGLTIVKTLVDRLNGQISLISEAGTGSEFTISIPVKTVMRSAL